MTTPQSAEQLLGEATQYPVGLVFDVTFKEFSVTLTTLPSNRLQFHIADGPYARIEEVDISVTSIRPGVFLVSWIEASGATVVHVEDFAEKTIHSHATLPGGTFFRMKGPLQIKRQETP